MWQDSACGRSTEGLGHCPFVPGFGGIPPYLAGREVQKRAGLDCLNSMQDGNACGRCLVLWGPRGNGKTTMLLWIENEAVERGIQAVSLDSAGIENSQDLVLLIAGHRGWFARLGKIALKAIQGKSRDRMAASLEQVLARRLRKAPLALLIDEAHTLNRAVGRSVLAAVQRLGGEGASILLVLAGTPGLPDHLGSMQATFWERSRILELDRLQERDAADAIRVPFEAAGRNISPDAVAQVVSESQGYPYFLQLWGRILWGSEQTPSKAVKASDVYQRRAEFELEQNTLYGLRYRELRRLGLVDAAVRVAEAYGDAPKLDSAKIERALEPLACQGVGQQRTEGAAELIRRLEAIGYIWAPGADRDGFYVRGIPSLMDYVVGRARANGRVPLDQPARTITKLPPGPN